MGDRDEVWFWTWFSEARDQYAVPDIASEIDRRLASLGIDRWEVGPLDAAGETMFLAFSPTHVNDIARLQEMVARAPSIEGWDVRVGKPRKFWNRIFKWSDATVEVDARYWRCVILRYDDGKYEIIILNPDIPPLLANQTQDIIEFVVEGELGEMRTLEKISGIFAEPPSNTLPLEASVAIDELDRLII
jgi:hypothetical protein